jgi:hypothetical protein
MPAKRKCLNERYSRKKTRKLNQQAQQRHRSLDLSQHEQHILSRSVTSSQIAVQNRSPQNSDVGESYENVSQLVFQNASASDTALNNVLTTTSIQEDTVVRPTRNSARIAAALIKSNFENNHDDELSQTADPMTNRPRQHEESPEGRRYRLQFNQVALRERRYRQINIQNQIQRQANQMRQVEPIAE